MATVLIKNGRIVTAVDDYQADLLIEDGAAINTRKKERGRWRHRQQP